MISRDTITGLQKDDNNRWYFGNQVSTYELSLRMLRGHLTEPHYTRSALEVHNTVEGNPQVYGTYAGLNNWSPIFTDAQLDAFISLCNTVLQRG